MYIFAIDNIMKSTVLLCHFMKRARLEKNLFLYVQDASTSRQHVGMYVHKYCSLHLSIVFVKKVFLEVAMMHNDFTDLERSGTPKERR